MKLTIWQRLFKRKRTNELLRQLIEEQKHIATKLDALHLHVQQLTSQVGVSTASQALAPGIIERQSTRGEESNSQQITAYLYEHGIHIKSIPAEKPIDPVHDEIARLIGSKFYSVAPLLDNIKRNMQLGNSFTINISQLPQQNIADITLLGRKLHELAFLTQFHYQKAPKCLLSARPSTLPDIQNFFSGNWLERYVKLLLEKVATDTHAHVAEIMMNPQIVLPNGDDFELDVLALVNQRMYWIECKTGAYQEHISKYSRFAQLIKLPLTQSVMVLPEAHESLTRNLSRAFGMCVVNLNELNQHVDSEFSKP